MTHISTRAACRVLLGTTLLLLGSVPAAAEAISFSLTMCEDLDVLRDPMNKTLAMNAAWKTQHSLMLERTAPYMELRNMSSVAELTQLNLTIGDLSRNYDWGQFVEASPGVNFSLIAPDTVAGGLVSNTLVINFTGLGPGDFVRFRVGIAADDASRGYVQDYRTTLFQVNGDDPSSNAVATVTFEEAGIEESIVEQLPNFDTGGMPTSTSLAFPQGYGMDTVMPFTLTGSGTIVPPEEEDPDPETEPVPEPKSVVLLSVGLLTFAAARWFGRKPR